MPDGSSTIVDDINPCGWGLDLLPRLSLPSRASNAPELTRRTSRPRAVVEPDEPGVTVK